MRFAWLQNSLCFFSVFDSVAIPYPKREFLTDDDNADAAAGHVTKTEPVVPVKTESSSTLLTQQQQQQAQVASQVQQMQQQQSLQNKQSVQQHNSIVQQSHGQPVSVTEWNLDHLLIEEKKH